MPRAGIPPWLHPLGMPAADFEALVFQTTLRMGLPLVGVARRHLERAYPLTAALLEPAASTRRPEPTSIPRGAEIVLTSVARRRGR